MRKVIQLSSFLLYVGLILIDPTNTIFHLKFLAFALMMTATFLTGRYRHYKEPYFMSIVLILCCLLSLCMAVLIYNSDILGSVSYLSAVGAIFVFYAMSSYSTDEIIIINYWCGLVLSAYISVLLLGFLMGFLPNLYDWAMNANATIMIAKRSILGFDAYMFFYKSMPITFFAFIYALRHKKYLSVILIVTPIIYGGSRTPMLMALLIIGYVFTTRSKRLGKFLTAFFIFGGILYILSLLLSSGNRDDGDAVKFSIANDLLAQSSLFGHGVGLNYYTHERGYTSSSEVTYIEMLYHYGIMLFLVVFTLFLYPFFELFKKKYSVDIRDYAFAYLLYLVNAGTNPLLMNSTGMFVYACCLMILAKSKYSNNTRQLGYSKGML